MAATDISVVNPTDHPLYFIDSNIWLAYFKWQRASRINDEILKKEIEPKKYYFDYLIWFEELLSSHTIPIDDKNKSIKHQRPKIVFTSLLATEVVNAYSRNISWKLYKNEFGKDSSKTRQLEVFKEYRKTIHYRKELRMLIDDITALKDWCTTDNDNFVDLDFFASIKDFTVKYDFNDFFYLNSCIKKSCPIVTHDGDFDNPYNDVFTKNKNMLATKIKAQKKAQKA